jgi:hypothetical protein
MDVPIDITVSSNDPSETFSVAVTLIRSCTGCTQCALNYVKVKNQGVGVGGSKGRLRCSDTDVAGFILTPTPFPSPNLEFPPSSKYEGKNGLFDKFLLENSRNRRTTSQSKVGPPCGDDVMPT